MLTALILAAATTTAAAENDVQDLADHLMEKGGTPAGICAVLRCGDGRLAVALAKSRRAKMWVYAQDDRPDMVAATRKAAYAEGLLGKQMFVGQESLHTVPFPNHYVDLLLVTDLTDADLPNLSASELLRALTPGGRAVIGHVGGGPLTADALADWMRKANIGGMNLATDEFGLWVELTKPMPEGIDDWGHWYHGPDNNPVSTDTVLKWPYLTQWMDKPYFGAQPRTVLVSGGRIITATGAANFVDPADAHLLQSRNAFNGTLLWTRKLDVNYPTSRSAFVATPSTVYMIDGKDVLCLDLTTGQELKRLRFAGLEGHLKWIALMDGKLLAMAGKPDMTWDKVDYNLKGKYPVPPLSREMEQTWGFGNEVAALNLATGKTLWVHKEPGTIDGRKIGALGGKVFFFAEETRAVCLDATTGSIVWTNETAEFREAATAVSRGFLTKRGNTLGETRPGILCTPEVITVHTLSMANMVALSVSNGKLLWVQEGGRRSGSSTHVMWLDGKLRTNSHVLDTLTGQAQDRYLSGSSGCGPVTASPYGFYSRHSIFYDRIRKVNVTDGSYRSACWQDGIPAHGMLISAPYVCGCNYQLAGFVILGPAAGYTFGAMASDEQRLDAATNLDPRSKLAPDKLDWPTYRANLRRSGASQATVPASAKQLWEYKPRVPFEPTSPVAAGDLVALAGDDGRVTCMDVATGRPRWTLWTGARVFAAPTLADGRVFVGSADGYVYAMDAADSRRLWRHRAAPAQRNMRVYDYLISTWPVNSGVVVKDGVAYAAAGIVDRDGTHVYALDTRTGKIKWQNNDSGHLDQSNHKGVSAIGFLAASSGRLWLPSGTASLPASYDMETGECSPWSRQGGSRGSEIGLFGDDYVVFGGRMLYSDQEFRRMRKGMEQLFVRHENGRAVFPEILLNGSTVLSPAWDDVSLLTAMTTARTLECWDVAVLRTRIDELKKAYVPPTKSHIRPRIVNAGQRRQLPDHPMRTWRAEKLEMYAFALSADAVVVLCGDGDRTQYVAVPSQTWSVKSLDRNTGSPLWEQELPGAPLLNGLCITRNGNVIVTLVDGRVLCFGAAGE